MKKILTILAIISYLSFFSQVVVTGNFPTIMNSESYIEAEIKINKGTIGNFAKYQLDVPAGYVVSALESRDGNFTFENQRAKIVWVSIPSEPEFTIKLKVKANSNATNPGTFLQKFYYLENNEKKEVEVAPVIINIGNVTSVSSSDTKPVDNTSVTEENKNTIQNNSSEEKSTKQETVQASSEKTTKTENNQNKTNATEDKNTVTKATENKNSGITSTEKESLKASNKNLESGMTYKIQIGAFSNQPSKNKFIGLGNVNIDLINGMHKVTVGNCKTLDDAIKFRDELKSKGYNGFIVKYKDGIRIN